MKYLLSILLGLAAGCAAAGHRGEFKPVTSNGEECLSRCGLQHSRCLAGAGGDAGGERQKACEAEYEACLKPCIDFDAAIKRSF